MPITRLLLLTYQRHWQARNINQKKHILHLLFNEFSQNVRNLYPSGERHIPSQTHLYPGSYKIQRPICTKPFCTIAYRPSDSNLLKRRQLPTDAFLSIINCRGGLLFIRYIFFPRRLLAAAVTSSGQFRCLSSRRIWECVFYRKKTKRLK